MATTSAFPQISKSTANFFYYPGVLIIVITHIALLLNPGMLSDSAAIQAHAILNLVGAALIAISWFGFCNNAIATAV